MVKLVVCSCCGKEHIPYAKREDCFDADDEFAIEDAKIYPSTITEDEIYINYPSCRECYIEDHGGPAPWDEEWLKANRDPNQKVKTDG